MVIEILGPDIDGYTVKVNGEIILECLSANELRELTLDEIGEIYSLISMEPSMVS